METIKTGRLLIRRFKQEDSEDLFEYLSNSEVVKYEPYEPFTMDQAIKEAADRAEKSCFFAVELQENSKLIGNVYLNKGEFDTWEIGYVFNKKYQGQGYAAESCQALMEQAFCNWGARRIVAMCTPLNERSWHLMERLGMRREGTLRQNIYFKYDSKGDPIWLDTYEYAILKKEWQDKKVKEEIIRCEKQYACCFSSMEQKDGIWYFKDAQIKDMYDHNFIYIPNGYEAAMASERINEELKKLQGKGFCKVVFEESFTKAMIQEIEEKLSCTMSWDETGRYVLDRDRVNEWQQREDCFIKIQANEEETKETVAMDIAVDGKRLGIDFCTRRAERMGQVYTSNKDVYNHLIYYKEKLIGSCVCYVGDQAAKIEDFAIIPEYQRKGFGTTLLKKAVQKALEMGAVYVFLDADEEDTAKDMYGKLGFTKIGGNYSLMWADWM